MLTSGMMKHIS